MSTLLNETYNSLTFLLDSYINSKVEEELKNYFKLPDNSNKIRIIDNLNKSNNYKYGITKREQEVLKLICNGLNNKEISEKLFITKATTKAHVHSILQKLDAKNRTNAMKIALETNLITCLDLQL